jgi:muramidase (phage lysozyme)
MELMIHVTKLRGGSKRSLFSFASIFFQCDYGLFSNPSLRYYNMTGFSDYNQSLTMTKPKARIKRQSPTAELYGATNNHSIQEHPAPCAICRSVYEGQTTRSQKALRPNGI